MQSYRNICKWYHIIIQFALFPTFHGGFTSWSYYMHAVYIFYSLRIQKLRLIPWAWPDDVTMFLRSSFKFLFPFLIRFHGFISYQVLQGNPNNGHCQLTIGYVGRQPLLGLLPWYLVMKSSLCNSYEDRAPVDEIYGCPNFIWDAVTWLEDRAPE